MMFGSQMRSLATLVLAVGALMLATSDRSLTAGEVDALAGGGSLVDAVLDGNGDLKNRLVQGFRADDAHPRGADFSKRKTWRRHLAEAPLPRWIAGTAVLTTPSGITDRQAAHWMACLLMCLAALGVGWLIGGGGGITAAIALLGSSAALDAAGGAGSGAIAALSMVALLLACERFIRRRKGALAIGAAWGLLLACHPAALFLIVPIFAIVAIAWRPEHSASRDTDLPLPAIPPALLITPAIAFAILIMLWPALWSHTGRGVANWLTDTWWAVQPDQTILGQHHHQPAGRPPAAHTALLQWLAWTPWPVLVAWIAGVVMTIRQGRRGLWSPILLLTTVLMVGTIDGGLFGARRSLLPWTWGPVAVTAAIGLSPVGPRIGGGIVSACLLWSLFLPPWGVEALGAEARSPTPTAALERIADTEPNARVHIRARVPGHRYALDTLRWRGGLPLQWSEAANADWIFVIGERPTDEQWRERTHDWHGHTGGVPLWRYPGR